MRWSRSCACTFETTWWSAVFPCVASVDVTAAQLVTSVASTAACRSVACRCRRARVRAHSARAARTAGQGRVSARARSSPRREHRRRGPSRDDPLRRLVGSTALGERLAPERRRHCRRVRDDHEPRGRGVRRHGAGVPWRRHLRLLRRADRTRGRPGASGARGAADPRADGRVHARHRASLGHRRLQRECRHQQRTRRRRASSARPILRQWLSATRRTSPRALQALAEPGTVWWARSPRRDGLPTASCSSRSVTSR